MSKLLHISEGLALPLDAVTQTFAILGIRGSGKTNTGVVMMEEMLKNDQQVVVLDPTDGWYGIRSSRDGKAEGFKVIIMGGEHGDLPLVGANGAVMADFVVQNRVPVVFSLRHLSIAEQRTFATDFGERLYNLKGQSQYRTALHIFVDEADEFIPQRIPPGHERMFGAYDRLVRRGRNAGIGLTMISQRPQVINKDTLSQCETLVCHRLLHKLDRKAVKEGWVEAHDIEGQADVFMGSLASLAKGETWVWSPSWLNIFERVDVRWRETFDSSFTPKAGEKPKTASKLAEVDLAALKEKLSVTIEKAKQDDPKELRRQIADLQKQVKGLETAKPSSKIETVDRKQLLDAVHKEVDQIIRNFIRPAIEKGVVHTLQTVVDGIESALDFAKRNMAAMKEDNNWGVLCLSEQAKKDIALAIQVLPAGTPSNIVSQNVEYVRRVIAQQRAATPVRPSLGLPPRSSNGNQQLGKGERAMLVAVAQFGEADRDQLSVLTGYKRSTRDAYVLRLQNQGFVEIQGSRIVVTKAGIAALGSDYKPLPTGDQLREYWMGRLPLGEKVVLGVLLQAAGKPVDREDISDQTGYKRSSRDAYLNRLSARRLIESVGRGQVAASATLFG